MILRLLTLATTSAPGLLLEQPIRPAMKRLARRAQHRKRAGERNLTFAENLQLKCGAGDRSVYQVRKISADQWRPVSQRASCLSMSPANSLLAMPLVWLRS